MSFTDKDPIYDLIFEGLKVKTTCHMTQHEDRLYLIFEKTKEGQESRDNILEILVYEGYQLRKRKHYFPEVEHEEEIRIKKFRGRFTDNKIIGMLKNNGRNLTKSELRDITHKLDINRLTTDKDIPYLIVKVE